MNKFILTLVMNILVSLCHYLNAQKTYSEKIYFKSDSSNLSIEEQHKIKTILSILDTTIINRIIIEGFCDDLDTDEHNMQLSINRSNRVKDFIQKNRAFKEDIFEIKGNGELPLSSNKPISEQRSQNRRVELSIDYSLKTRTSPPTTPTLEVVEAPASTLLDNQKVGDKITLENILFEGGRHILLPESYDDLDILTTTLIQKKKYHILILGHICCIRDGNDGLDHDTGLKNLSYARAKVIYDYLVTHGVDKNRLSYKGMKADYPLGKGDKYDRRVEIEITAIDSE